MKNGKHIKEEIKEKFSGSLRFCSRAANGKGTLGRKDELESWVYSMIFMVTGQLPWMEIRANNMKDANEEVFMLKGKGRGELLAGLPGVFGEMLSYLDQLKFNTVPDYGRLREGLGVLMKKNGYELDYKYDW